MEKRRDRRGDGGRGEIGREGGREEQREGEKEGGNIGKYRTL